MNDDYRAALDFLYGRLNYERAGMPTQGSGELKLGRLRRLLRRLGDPQDALRIVHVAGTKGKGSTAAMIAASLDAAGLETGLFTSPHLHCLEERFVLAGRPIDRSTLVGLVQELRPTVEALDHDHADRPLTFFEITTALGLVYFARSGAGAVVLEVGMGGRLDSTNAVRPIAGVITSISFDHVKQLGPTLAHIAAEKAGILKRGMPAVSGVTDDEPRQAIRRIARQRRTPLRELGPDFSYQYLPPVPPLSEPCRGQAAVRTWRRDWGILHLPMPGAHQAHNLAVALAALDQIAEVDPRLEVSPDQVHRALDGLRMPARVEVLGRSPWLVIDGAHNVASARALASAVVDCFPPGPRTLVFGTSRDKDLEGQLRALLPLFRRVIATRFIENPRAVPPHEIAAVVESLGATAEIAPDPAAAIDLARASTPPDGLICLTGSLFLAAEARALLLGLPTTTLPGPLPLSR